MITNKIKFPDLTIPGFLLNAEQLDELIEDATEILDELGPDLRLSRFIEDAAQLRAVHDQIITSRTGE